MNHCNRAKAKQELARSKLESCVLESYLFQADWLGTIVWVLRHGKLSKLNKPNSTPQNKGPLFLLSISPWQLLRTPKHPRPRTKQGADHPTYPHRPNTPPPFHCPWPPPKSFHSSSLYPLQTCPKKEWPSHLEEKKEAPGPILPDILQLMNIHSHQCAFTDVWPLRVLLTLK